MCAVQDARLFDQSYIHASLVEGALQFWRALAGRYVGCHPQWTLSQ